MLKARLKKAPEKPKEEPKPEPKKTKVRVGKAKKYEDLPEIPDYERPDLEVYERTELDEKEREKKAFEPPQIRIPEDEELQQVESKRKGSYQRGAASENGAPDKSDATLRKGSLRPINENEAMSMPTLKATPAPPVIEVCAVSCVPPTSKRSITSFLTMFLVDPRCSRDQWQGYGKDKFHAEHYGSVCFRNLLVFTQRGT